MTPERRKRIHSVLSNRQPDLTVITDKVIKERNLAAIVRTCDAVGIQTLHSVSDTELYRTFRGTSAGAQKYVGVEHHTNILDTVASFKDKGFTVVAAHLSSSALNYKDVDYTKPTVLLMGAEAEGVSNEALKLVDTEIMVPMMGMVESFNVSVACAVILSEAQRQRQEASMYGRARLPNDEYKSLFFQWAYPRLAEFCDRKGVSYPDLDENDDLIPGAYPELCFSNGVNQRE